MILWQAYIVTEYCLLLISDRSSETLMHELRLDKRVSLSMVSNYINICYAYTIYIYEYFTMNVKYTVLRQLKKWMGTAALHYVI